MAKKQRNTPERAEMLRLRRMDQESVERCGRQPPAKASLGRANMPGGERRYQARLKAARAAS